MFLCGKVVKQDIILHANTHLLTHIIYRRLHIHPIHLNGAAGGWKQPCQKGPETREYIVVKSFMLIKTNSFFFFFFLKMQYVVSRLHSGGFSSSIVTQQRRWHVPHRKKGSDCLQHAGCRRSLSGHTEILQQAILRCLLLHYLPCYFYLQGHG